MAKGLDLIPSVAVGVYFLALVYLYRKLSWTAFLASVGVGAVLFSLTDSVLVASVAGIVVLYFAVHAVRSMEGFNTRTPTPEIANTIRSMKAGGYNSRGDVRFATENIVSNGWNRPGFGIGGPLVEGFENAKHEKPAPAAKETNEAPADAPTKKDPMAQPFTLGEIPAQVKNGPHIDASSTLLKAIQSLNPDQIKAMGADTQQLIETQKSLMGMLNSMKPMMNDGKQLMDTFQQMFGQA